MSFLHFVSLNPLWIQEMRELFTGIPVQITEADIQTIPHDNTIFVSPANCLGYMDGGIDYILSRKMFPGIEQSVVEKIQTLGIHTFLGRSYMPIGSAVLVPYKQTALISAPTMFLPSDVSTTQNAYHSFLAALILFHKYRRNHPIVQTLVVTSHCCGYGNMSAKDSAAQMKRAYDDFVQDNYPYDTNEDDTILITPPEKIDSEQMPNSNEKENDYRYCSYSE
jgi:O-acetyl-ADP-ribose deacetylase (regulator of RNase III)